jgi:hypothetical protein
VRRFPLWAQGVSTRGHSQDRSDPNLPQSIETTRCRFISGRFPDSLGDDGPFDAITMLAMLEHIPAAEQPRWAPACAPLLKPGGFLIITAPSPVVDRILAILKALRLIDGMFLEEHYGFEPHRVPSLFANGSLELVKARRFQLGCNNLFVFRRAFESSHAPRQPLPISPLGQNSHLPEEFHSHSEIGWPFLLESLVRAVEHWQYITS